MLPSPMKDDKFTAREVVVLVEDLRSEFRAVSEVVVPLREDMAEVKERLTGLEGEVRLLKDAMRVGLPSINARLLAL